MVSPVNNAGPNPNNYSGVGIYCNVIDPTKLPPDHPLLNGSMPTCTVVGPNGGGCYPAGYYMNNYAQNTVKKRVTVLTDSLIKELDKQLESNDPELRVYAANRVKRLFSEDVTRYNDEGLNVLLNKMLINPYDKKVRSHALNLINTQLAGGNKDTETILERLKQDPTALDRHRNEAEIALLNLKTETTVVNKPVTSGGTVLQ